MPHAAALFFPALPSAAAGHDGRHGATDPAHPRARPGSRRRQRRRGVGRAQQPVDRKGLAPDLGRHPTCDHGHESSRPHGESETMQPGPVVEPLTDAREQAESGQRQHQHATGQPLTLVLLDIDHFKRINDNFGHAAGDEVLTALGHTFTLGLRGSDTVCRFGGEEFVILLRSTSKEDAKMIFERFRENVARYPFPQVGTVTISIGFAHIDPFEPAVGIIGRADQALYFAKSNGRNRVCHYEDLVSSGELRIEVSQDSVEFF